MRIFLFILLTIVQMSVLFEACILSELTDFKIFYHCHPFFYCAAKMKDGAEWRLSVVPFSKRTGTQRIKVLN